MTTKLYESEMELFVSQLGAENPLPVFRFQGRTLELDLQDSLLERDLMWTRPVIELKNLPYRTQDGYDRAQKKGKLPVVVLENSKLKATFYPQYGGRMASLYDKVNERELLFKNPAFQPANLALRNAWFSGGIEWNGPVHGHQHYTCSPVYMGIVDSDRGQVLRIYEFDRQLETTWQVDIWLPDDSDKLYTHGYVRNVNDEDMEYYWWTNIAVAITDETRILAPHNGECICHAPDQAIYRTPCPYKEDFDGSYPTRYPVADSIFFDNEAGDRPWIASVEGNGAGLMNVSTRALMGRKLFVWGSNQGGDRWSDFLARKGQGAYAEIQGGITSTQLQNRPLAANTNYGWTECFMPWQMDATAAMQEDHLRAVSAAARELDIELPEDELEEVNKFMESLVDAPVKNITRGSAWGRLFEQRRGAAVSPGLVFDEELHIEQLIWQELLDSGSVQSLDVDSGSIGWNVSEGWVAVLEKSVAEHGTSWVHELLLGTAYMEQYRTDEAWDCFIKSEELKPNWMAFRNLAVVSAARLDDELARSYYDKAMAIVPDCQPLIVEYIEHLAKFCLFDEVNEAVKSLPGDTANHERVQLALATVALVAGECGLVLKVLEREFATVCEGESLLTDLWFGAFVKQREIELGRVLTEDEKHGVEADNPPPERIDFRMFL